MTRDTEGDGASEVPGGPEIEDEGQSPFQESELEGPGHQQNPTPSANSALGETPYSSGPQFNPTITLGGIFAATSSPAVSIHLPETDQCIFVRRPPAHVPSPKPGLSTSTDRSRPLEMKTQPMVNMVSGRGEIASSCDPFH